MNVQEMEFVQEQSRDRGHGVETDNEATQYERGAFTVPSTIQRSSSGAS